MTWSLSVSAAPRSSPFSPDNRLTLSSSRASRSSFRFRHLEAATRFLMRFLSALIRSWSSMSMGDSGGVSGTFCGSSLNAPNCAGTHGGAASVYASHVWLRCSANPAQA